MEKITLANLMLEVTREFFVGYPVHSKAYRIYNKFTKTIEYNIHVIFDESNECKLSLKLCKYSDE